MEDGPVHAPWSPLKILTLKKNILELRKVQDLLLSESEKGLFLSGHKLGDTTMYSKEELGHSFKNRGLSPSSSNYLTLLAVGPLSSMTG